MRNKRITAVWRTRSLDRNVEYQVCLEGVSRRGHWPLLSLGARLPLAFGDVLLFVYGVGLSGTRFVLSVLLSVAGVLPPC